MKERKNSNRNFKLEIKRIIIIIKSRRRKGEWVPLYLNKNKIYIKKGKEIRGPQCLRENGKGKKTSNCLVFCVNINGFEKCKKVVCLL